MKQPRIDAFVPKKQTIPELKSSLEDMPVIEKSKPPGKLPPFSEKPIGQENQSEQLISERVNARTPVRPTGKRIITRNSFEIYEDQMDSLRKHSFKEKMEGKLGSMSQMVRDAIDTYLKERASTK
jgi:hypothetical protein